MLKQHFSRFRSVAWLLNDIQVRYVYALMAARTHVHGFMSSRGPRLKAPAWLLCTWYRKARWPLSPRRTAVNRPQRRHLQTCTDSYGVQGYSTLTSTSEVWLKKPDVRSPASPVRLTCTCRASAGVIHCIDKDVAAFISQGCQFLCAGVRRLQPASSKSLQPKRVTTPRARYAFVSYSATI